jgi:hypothetical protein
LLRKQADFWTFSGLLRKILSGDLTQPRFTEEEKKEKKMEEAAKPQSPACWDLTALSRFMRAASSYSEDRCHSERLARGVQHRSLEQN